MKIILYIMMFLSFYNIKLIGAQASLKVASSKPAKSIELNYQNAKSMIKTVIDWYLKYGSLNGLDKDLDQCLAAHHSYFEMKSNSEIPEKTLESALKSLELFININCKELSRKSDTALQEAQKIFRETPNAFFETLRLFELFNKKNSKLYNLVTMSLRTGHTENMKILLPRENAIALFTLGIPWFNKFKITEDELPILRECFKEKDLDSIKKCIQNSLYEKSLLPIVEYSEKITKETGTSLFTFFNTLIFFENIFYELKDGTTLVIDFENVPTYQHLQLITPKIHGPKLVSQKDLDEWATLLQQVENQPKNNQKS